MLISQSDFFGGLEFERYNFDLNSEKIECYRGKDGRYYRIDHFGTFYVIECAESEENAKLNQFDDGDLYDDSLSKEDIINAIQTDLMNYMNE